MKTIIRYLLCILAAAVVLAFAFSYAVEEFWWLTRISTLTVVALFRFHNV